MLCIKNNRWFLYIQKKIMSNSHEGLRDRDKLLTLKREPSKIGRRQEVFLCPESVAERAFGGFRDQVASRPVSGCHACGEGPSRLEKTR